MVIQKAGGSILTWFSFLVTCFISVFTKVVHITDERSNIFTLSLTSFLEIAQLSFTSNNTHFLEAAIFRNISLGLASMLISFNGRALQLSFPLGLIKTDPLLYEFFESSYHTSFRSTYQCLFLKTKGL